MAVLITSAFMLGLFGSFHCLGMCGPIALALPLNTASFGSKLAGILSYNFGRIVTYSAIGMLFGIFGEGLQIAGILQITSISLGVIILLSLILPTLFRKMNFTAKWYLKFNNWVNKLIGVFLKRKSNGALFVLGLLNGLLPCGLVFMAIAGALVYGSAPEGALFMAIFGLGTLPMMGLLPFLSHSLSASVRKKMTKAIPYVMALFAVLFILRGMNLGIPYVSPKFSADGITITKCCHHTKN